MELTAIAVFFFFISTSHDLGDPSRSRARHARDLQTRPRYDGANKARDSPASPALFVVC